MASLSSPNYCCSSSSPDFAYSSSVGFHQFQKTIRFPLISQKNLGSKDVSLRSKSTALTDVVMQDGALAAKLVNANEAPPKKLEGLSTVNHPVEEETRIAFDGEGDKLTVSITVVGASGDLAKKKIFPALFALYYEDCLPEHFTIFGYARSKMSDAELRNMVSRTLTCRIDKRENCGENIKEFLKRCFYHSGQYDSEENFTELNAKLKEHEIKQDLVEDVATCSSSF